MSTGCVPLLKAAPEPDQVADIDLPGGAVQITAVPAHHGSPEMFERNGPVPGFVLR